MTLYWRRDHIDDAPPGSIYVADNYEDPYLTMVPATHEEVRAWLMEREIPTPVADEDRGTLSSTYRPPSVSRLLKANPVVSSK